MIYKLADGRVVDLMSNQAFTITNGRQIISGTYTKSILDTNKFIVNFNSNNKDFLLYFDLDSNITIGEGSGIIKLNSLGKQSSKSILRNMFNKLSFIIERIRGE